MPPLALDPGVHYLRNSLVLAHLSDASYDDAPDSTAAFKKTSFLSATTFNNKKTNTQGFVTATVDELVIAFRGSQEPRDWVTNITLTVVDAKKGKVHKGFSESIDSIWTELNRKIAKARNNGQRIWITGHSLGGALATIAARRLADDGLTPHLVATFGQPRTGDTKFAANYKLNHHRFVNNKDLVPQIPLRLPPVAFPLSFYTHVGELEFFDQNQKLTAQGAVELGAMPELRDALGPFSNATTEAAAKKLILSGFEDHKIKNYIACLVKNISP